MKIHIFKSEEISDGLLTSFKALKIISINKFIRDKNDIAKNATPKIPKAFNSQTLFLWFDESISYDEVKDGLFPVKIFDHKMAYAVFEFAMEALRQKAVLAIQSDDISGSVISIFNFLNSAINQKNHPLDLAENNLRYLETKRPKNLLIDKQMYDAFVQFLEEGLFKINAN